MKKFKYYAIFLMGVMSIPTYGIENNQSDYSVVPMTEIVKIKEEKYKMIEDVDKEDHLRQLLSRYEQLVKDNSIFLEALIEISINYLKEEIDVEEDINNISIKWFIDKGIWSSEQIESYDPKNRDEHKAMIEQVITYGLGMTEDKKNNTGEVIDKDTDSDQEGNVAEGIDENNNISQGGNIVEEVDYFKFVPMGSVKESELSLLWENSTYPLYYYNYTNFISTSVLEQLGFSVIEEENLVYIQYKEKSLDDTIVQSTKESSPLLGTDNVYMSDKRIYVGNCLTYSLKVGKEYLVPIRSLNDYFTLDVAGEVCSLDKVEEATTDYVQLKVDRMVNQSQENVRVEVVHTYINNEGILDQEVQTIKLGAKEEGIVSYNFEGMHTNSVITRVEVLDQQQTTVKTITKALSQYGQETVTWQQMYNKNAVIYDSKALEQLFPSSKIIGTIKYTTNGIQKGEKVEVLRAESGYCYYVLKDGKEIEIPWNSISIPKNPPVCTERATTAQIEAYINQIEITSDTSYLVWTDIYRQRTYVFIKEEGRWKLYRDMLCTTGNNITPTPRGMYKLRAYVPYFGLEKGYKCKDAVQIFGDYLYHSLMMDPSGSYVLKGNGPLGRQASNGCIRLSVEDANWFYNTLPLKTRVWIN